MARCGLCGKQVMSFNGLAGEHKSRGGCASTGPEPMQRCEGVGHPVVGDIEGA